METMMTFDWKEVILSGDLKHIDECLSAVDPCFGAVDYYTVLYGTLEVVKHVQRYDKSICEKVGCLLLAMHRGNLEILEHLFRSYRTFDYEKKVIIRALYSNRIDIITWYEQQVGLDVAAYVYSRVLFDRRLYEDLTCFKHVTDLMASKGVKSVFRTEITDDIQLLHENTVRYYVQNMTKVYSDTSLPDDRLVKEDRIAKKALETLRDTKKIPEDVVKYIYLEFLIPLSKEW